MIKMLQTTSYNGKSYKQGDTCKSPDPSTKKRWIENKIAEITGEKKHTKSDLFETEINIESKPKQVNSKRPYSGEKSTK